MRIAPLCPRCRGPLVPPGAWSSAWVCAAHGEVGPLLPPRRPRRESLEVVRAGAGADLGAVATAAGVARDRVRRRRRRQVRRAGRRRGAVRPGTARRSGRPGDRRGRAGDRPRRVVRRPAGPGSGAGFGVSASYTKVEIDGHPVSMWEVGADDAAAFAGEALANWLWAILWPGPAGILMLEELSLRDLRDDDRDLPYGALSPRLEA